MIDDILEMVKWIEAHPIVGAATLASLGYSIVSVVRFAVKMCTKPSITVNSVFWTFGNIYRISAVLKYTPSENTSGYTQSQYSRQDQWEKVIEIQSNFWGCRHKIVPKDPLDVLVVNISRNGKEREKMVKFNR